MTSVKTVVGNCPLACKGVSFCTEDGIAIAQQFTAELGDVVIATYPKTGTTWMQQICHQLRTGGHTEFDEISEEGIVPWLETSPSLGIQISIPQIAKPRCFKSHQPLSCLSHLSGARFLCSVRDPEATLLSQFKFMLSKGHPAANTNDVNDFAKSSFFIPGGEGDFEMLFGKSMWEMYAESWQCRELPEVCVIPYEHMRKSPAVYLNVIADFMGLPPPSEELIAKVLELSSFDWMAAHDCQFDDHHVGTRLAKLGRKGAGKSKPPAPKINLQVGADVNVTITEETKQLLTETWQKLVTPITGHKSYKDMLKDFERQKSTETAAPKIELAPLGAVEMKVTMKRGAGFYANSACSFLRGVEGKPAGEGKESQDAKPAVEHLRISGTGDAVATAMTAALKVTSEGLGTITRIQTAYPTMGGGRGCAQILIDLKK